MGDPAIYTQDFTRGLPAFITSFPLFASLKVYIYWIVSLVLISYLSYIMYTPLNRQVSATLFWIIGFMMTYFYYIKWFVVGKNAKKSSDSLTRCPDYLTNYVKPGSADGSIKPTNVCLDFVGVSRNGVLKKCDKDVATCLANPAYYLTPPTGNNANISSYQDQAAQYGLIWTSVLGDA